MTTGEDLKLVEVTVDELVRELARFNAASAGGQLELFEYIWLHLESGSMVRLPAENKTSKFYRVIREG